MKKKFILLILGIFIVSSLVSCKKNQPEPEPTVKELLTGSMWNLYLLERHETSTGNVSAVLAMDKDYEFTMNDYYYIYDNTGQVVEYGSYELKEDIDPMTISLLPRNGNPVTYSVAKFDESEMEFKEDHGSYYVIYKFNKIN